MTSRIKNFRMLSIITARPRWRSASWIFRLINSACKNRNSKPSRTRRKCRSQKRPATVGVTRAADSMTWLDARVHNIAGEGEMLAFGLSGVTGVLVLEASASRPWPRRDCERMMLSFHQRRPAGGHGGIGEQRTALSAGVP